MRIARLGFVSVSVMLLARLPAAEPAPTLTLEEALAAAETVNLTVLLSRETATQAAEAINQVRASSLSKNSWSR